MAKRKSRARTKPSPPPAYTGDHGSGTLAANSNTRLEPITNEDGSNPNNRARRRRIEVIGALDLTMRQQQAAIAIRDAYCRVEMLSSGSPLAERVQSSPKPDATVAGQVDANSELIHVTKPILRADREIVHHICCDNLPVGLLSRRGIPRASARFKQAMDRVADHLRY